MDDHVDKKARVQKDEKQGARLRSKLWGQTGLNTVAYSFDGKLLASCADDRSVCLWDQEMGEIDKKFFFHSHWVLDIAFSPDAKRLASTDGLVHLMDVETGMTVWKYDPHIHRLFPQLAYSPDGKTLAAGCGPSIVMLDTATGKPKLTMDAEVYVAASLAYSPDGKTVISGSSDGSIRLWDPETGHIKQTIQGYGHWVRAAKFSPDGKTFATAGNDHYVRLWDVGSDVPKNTQPGYSRIGALAFAPDGKTIAWTGLGTGINLWDLATGTCQASEHTEVIRSLQYSADGKTIAGGTDNCVNIFSVTQKNMSAEEIEALFGEVKNAAKTS